LFVENVDATVAQAVAAGAKITSSASPTRFEDPDDPAKVQKG
jgi:hypothetical protein